MLTPGRLAELKEILKQEYQLDFPDKEVEGIARDLLSYFQILLEMYDQK